MIKVRNLAALLALSGVAVLPACSMFGGDRGREASRSTPPTQTYASAQPNYGAQPTTELTPDVIRQVQQTLQHDGMYQGRVDGVWGPGTQAGVRNFQQRHNLNVSGQLDQDTIAAMNLAGGAQQPANQRYSNYNNPPPANATPEPPPPNTNAPR